MSRRKSTLSALLAVSALGGAGILLAAGPSVEAQAADSATFDEVGTEDFTVPEGVVCLHVVATGAAGGQGGDYLGILESPPEGSEPVGGAPGNGGQVEADLVVTPGETVQINVGGQGEAGGSGSAGGFNGGGTGGSQLSLFGNGGGGGGASDVRVGGTDLADRVVVASGGGGGGSGEFPEVSTATTPAEAAAAAEGTGGVGGAGGDGGGVQGSDGGDGVNAVLTSATGGGGGTGSSGGTAGVGEPGSNPPFPGGPGEGGAAGDIGVGGGGGGGGLFGGGGGGSGKSGSGAGGGGGSSVGPDDAVLTSGVNAGNGSVELSWEADTPCGDALPDIVIVDPVPEPDVVAATPPFTG